MDNQNHSSIKRVIACLMAVLMILTAAPLSAFAANEHKHEFEAQGAVTVALSGNKYVVGDETFKCASCSETKKEKVYLDTDFTKFADQAKQILDSKEFKTDSSDYVAVKSAYDALTALTSGTHYAKFIERRIKAVEAAVNAFRKTAAENVNAYTVKFVYYTEDHKEQTVSQAVAYGSAAVAPTLSSNFYWNEGRHYEFNGKWDKAFNKVTGDLVVTAQYKSGNEHDFVDKAEKVDSTCKIEGREKIEKCRVCGFEKGGEAIAKKDHIWGDWVENAFLSFLATKKTKTCSVCGETYTLCIKENHNTKNVEAKAPSCFEDGYNAHVQCKDCDYNTKEVVKAIGHHTEVVDPARKATCTEAGLKEGKHCSVCNAVIVPQEPEAALGHDYSKEIMTDEYRKSAATCTAAAVYFKCCSRCGKVTPDETFSGKELGHKFTKKLEGTSTKSSDATCTEPAKYFYSCETCGAVGTETFTVGAALGHDWSAWVNNSDKKTKTRTCKRGCVEKTCIDGKDGKPAHDLASVPAKAATCVSDGNDGYWKCKNCTYEADHKTYPAGHKFSKTETAVVELATCLVPGKAEEFKFCVRENCPDKGEPVIKSDVVVPALGHKYGNFTDDQNAKTHTKVCLNSGCTASVEGHTVTENHTLKDVEAVAATCLVDGTEAGVKCEVCSYTTAKVIKATGKHTEVELPEVPATCKKAGLTAGKKCSVCGEILVAQEEIPMLTEHTPVAIPEKAATCTADGNTAGKKCSVCEKILEEPTVIKALGHDYEVVTPAKEATCTEDGATEGKKCKACGDEVKAEVIPNKGGHKEVPIPEIPGDCTTDKSVGGKKCSVCGAIIEEPTVTPALGHAYEVLTPEKKANLTEDGATEGKKCSVCGDEIESEVIAKIQSVAPTVSKVNYIGRAWTPSVIAKDANGKTLVKGVDFTAEYKNNIYPGTAVVTVTFTGDYEGTVARTFKINYSFTARTAKLQAVSQTKNSIKVSWSAVSGAAGYRVQLFKGNTLVRTVVTSKTSVNFKKLENGKKLSAGTEYKVVVTAFSKLGGKVYYSTASRSLLTATKTAAPSVKSVEAGKGSVTLKWKKVAGATGYTVYYSTKKDSGFKAVKATTKTSRTVKKLKSGKTYYVKVVANKKVSGKRISSAFSKTYKVTVK